MTDTCPHRCRTRPPQTIPVHGSQCWGSGTRLRASWTVTQSGSPSFDLAQRIKSPAHDPQTAFGFIGPRSSPLRSGQIALRPLGQLCCCHAHPRHTESAKRTSTTATAVQRKNVYCERPGRGLSPMGDRCSMSKAPNEAEGPTRPKDQQCYHLRPCCTRGRLAVAIDASCARETDRGVAGSELGRWSLVPALRLESAQRR